MNEIGNLDYQLPYDPSDVDIRQQKFAVGHLMNMITHSEIELWRELDYQRKSNAWDAKQKSRLIESLIMRIPLPIFYFDGSDKPWKVIDGLHRLTTLYTFLKGPSFPLKDLEYLKELEGIIFHDLPFKYRRVIEEFIIEAYVINPGTPDKVKLNIFQRINTGGSSLSRQEIRNAFFRGEPANFVSKLAESNLFLRATQEKISTKKMKDKQVALRFISFYNFLDNYESPLESFLDQSMERIYKFELSDRNDIFNAFERSMRASIEIFENKAFYLLNIHGQRQSTNINVALFESWAVNLAKCDYNKLKLLISQRVRVMDSFVLLLQDIEFHKSISSGTSSKKAIHTRFLSIKNLINNI